MRPRMRWAEGVSHLGEAVEPFLRSLLATGERSVLYIAGAGFDPRATHLADIISSTDVARTGVFIREERPDPHPELVRRGDESERRLRAAFPEHTVERVEIFSDDHVPIGGMRALAAIRRLVVLNGLLERSTDVIVDLSALSIGVSFPIVGILRERIEDQGLRVNLHVVAATGGPRIESAIIAEHAEGVQLPPGFKGKVDLGESPKQLWIPQLSAPKHSAYRTLFNELDPAETCPVFPFPSKDPRGVEALLDQFRRELVDDWRVQPGQMLYAAEDDPLDLYRTLARIHLARTDVYERAGEQSETVLSPIGSKAMAIGALLAAIEFNLPVAYVEARRYIPPAGEFVETPDRAGFVHVWMLGDVYPD